MDNKQLSELMFPNIDKTPDYYEKAFPERGLPEDAIVTRMGPSPTGFMHLGNLYTAFIAERMAHQSGGVLFLRIEDTDDKRFVEGAIDIIIDSLKHYDIIFDEGAGKTEDTGDYGPYYQSRRAEIYQCFAKEMVARGQAYPCFLTAEEIDEIRAGQEAAKETPGIYGKYSKYRNATPDQAAELIKAGKEYVVRLRSGGDTECAPEDMKQISFVDGIRGEIVMPENNQDVVILKANGIPTYHFAHVCDDHLMRSTHVVRGGEWLSSAPIHVELFSKLGLELPIYCHTGNLMKLDNGNKRKLSKRKDPESSLEFYRREGYHPKAVREYLMTLINSNYEEWHAENPDLALEDFPVSADKMNPTGTLFDMDKLNDVSKEILVTVPAGELYDFFYGWAEEFKPEILPLLSDRGYIERILDIGRNDAKPRKDFICCSQIFDFIKYFFDEYFEMEDSYPEEAAADRTVILEKYLATYDHSDDQSTWFEKIRTITDELGYAVKPKDFKKHPEDYKGHVGHVSSVIRIALVGRSQSPDVWEIQQIMGEEKVRARISREIQ